MSVADQAAKAAADALQQAMSAIQNRRPDKAESIAREVLARYPQHPGAWHLLGFALLSQQRPRDAVAPLEKASGLRADPVFETHLAIALRQCGRNADALAWLERASGRRPAFWLAFHELGLVLLSLRRIAEAQDAVQRGIDLAPTVPQLNILLGTICLERADWSGAKTVFARVLGMAPGHPSALYGLGAALMYDNEFAPAAERLKQAVGIDPTYAQAWIHYGLCLLELGEWEQGIVCLRRAIEVAPHMYEEAVKTLVTTGRGRFPIRPSAVAKLLRPQAQAQS